MYRNVYTCYVCVCVCVYMMKQVFHIFIFSCKQESVINKMLDSNT